MKVDRSTDRDSGCCSSSAYASHVCLTCWRQHCHCPDGVPGPQGSWAFAFNDAYEQSVESGMRMKVFKNYRGYWNVTLADRQVL